MALKRLALQIALMVAMTGSAAAEKVRITFTGACDFVYETVPLGTLVTVYLPPFEGQYGQKGELTIDPHDPFIRFGFGGAFILPPKAKLSIDGTNAGPVTVTPSFETAVHEIKDKPSQQRMNNAVSFALPAGGRLRAQGGYERWYYLMHDEQPTSTTPTESMASGVEFDFDVPNNLPIVLRAGSNEFRIPFQNGVASVMIGYLPPKDIFFDGTYTPICEDMHYVLHQKLRDKSTEDAKTVRMPRWSDCVSLVKGSESKVLYGPRNDCFMARWAK